jgi:hypothetical protein
MLLRMGTQPESVEKNGSWARNPEPGRAIGPLARLAYCLRLTGEHDMGMTQMGEQAACE